MKALIIEDCKKQASATANRLRQCGYESDIAADGETGLQMLCERSYEVALVDIKLPKLDGLGVIKQARKRHVRTPIIVLSVIGSSDAKVAGLDAGADDYLSKPFSEEELRARIDALLRRHTIAKSTDPLICDTLMLDPIGATVTRGDRKVHLSKTEYELLLFLLRHKGKVVSKKLILERVWDFAGAATDHVVEMAICELRKKVNWTGDRELIQTKRGLGYVIE